MLALLFSLALVVLNGAWIVPWYWTRPHPAAGDLVRVLSFNINVANDQWHAIANAVQSVASEASHAGRLNRPLHTNAVTIQVSALR